VKVKVPLIYTPVLSRTENYNPKQKCSAISEPYIIFHTCSEMGEMKNGRTVLVRRCEEERSFGKRR